MYAPRLSKLHVRDAILVPKREFEWTECIKGATIETNLFLKCLLYEGALIDRYFCFARHVASSKQVVAGWGCSHLENMAVRTIHSPKVLASDLRDASFRSPSPAHLASQTSKQRRRPPKPRRPYNSFLAYHASIMTTAHRPTFDPARGKEAQRGPAYHQRLLPAHTFLKHRQPGQGGDADAKRDLRAELLEAEARHFAKKNGTFVDEDSTAEAHSAPKRPLEAVSAAEEVEEDEADQKRRRIEMLEKYREIDADDSSESSESSDDEYVTMSDNAECYG